MGLITSVVLTAISIAATIASTAYQISKAKAAKKKAKKAEEARKGFELVVEGTIEALPIVYGKAKIGGVRVYHNTSSNFKYVNPGSDKILQTGPPAVPSSSYTGVQYYNAEHQPVYGTVIIPSKPSGLLTGDKTGTKNEFLYFQQALCQGPINQVWDVIIDDSRYLSDPEFGTQPDGGGDKVSTIKAAMRIDCFYSGGANALISAAFPERSTALFTNIAHADAVIRLDRDDPQFNAVPNIQYLIEGRKVRSVIGGVLSGTYAYSNNPALCLLDYLLDPISGQGMSVDDIDLNSFEAAAAICATIAQTNVITGGLIYKPVDGARNITNRDIPLYECNLVVDVSQPIRDNVEALLGTMGDARLVWSSGKYKLLLQYPIDNALIDLAATFTDDDLLLDQEIEIKWPTSEERLNSCIVRFNNETSEFKEDSVSWPPKTAGTVLKGVGGRRFPIVSGWDDSKTYNKLLNSYAVWDGSSNDSTMVWKFKAPLTGVYTVQLLIDNSGSISIGSDTLSCTYHNQASRTVNLVQNTVYTITVTAHNSGSLKGAAATLTHSLGNMVWSTRSEAFSDYISVSSSDAVYQAMLAEDGGVELETDIFEEGVTDYYHALAKAEEMVRTSRSAFGIKFQYKIMNIYLEPGDIVKLQSEVLSLGFSGDVFIRVNEIRVLEGGVGEVTGTRFDYTQLAWAVKDDEYLRPANIYDFSVTAPEWLLFNPDYNPMRNSSGTLSWAKSSDSRVVNYILYVHLHSDLDEQGYPIFREIGRTPETPFYLPLFNASSAIFGVRAVTSSGAMSAMTTTGMGTTLNLLYDPNIQRTVTLQASHIAFIKSLDGTFNVPSITLTAALSGFSAPTFRWFVDDVLIPGETTATLVVAAVEPPQKATIKVEVREAISPNNIFEGIDYITLFSISEGSSTLNMTFSNESVNLLSDASGVIYPADQLPLLIDTYVARGATLLSSGVTFAKIDDGCTSSINPVNGQITITAVSQPSASISVSATVGLDTVSRVISINKNLQGSTVLPRLARLQTANLAFVTPSGSSTPIPSSITLMDASVGYDSPVRKWYLDDVLQAETSSSFVLPSFAPNGTSKRVKLQISESDLSFENFDEIAIFSVKEGSDAWSFSLTDLVKAIPANNSGVVYPGYLPYTVSALVYKGLENYTTGHSIVYSLENITGLTASIDSGTGVMTITAISAQSAFVDIRATDPSSGATGTVRYRVTKVLDGLPGDDGPPGVPGTDSYSLTLSNPVKAVNANSDGTIKSGQLPFTVNTIIKKGTTTIINPAVTFSVDSYNNLTGSIAANGDVTITGLSAEEGYAIIRATEVSTGVTGTVRLSVFKVRDGATQDVQAILSAGVSSIVAGVGSSFKLNVDTVNALITIAANGLVYKGTASPGSTRPGIGISATGVAMGYNQSINGVWKDSIAIDSFGNVTIAGTLTASSVINTGVTLSSGQSMSTIRDNAASGKSISDALLVNGTSVLKGVLVPTDTGAIKTGTITWDSATGALTGGTGVAITKYGIIGAASDAATFSLNTSTGALTLKGDITGGSNINITGIGQFGGQQTLNSFNAAIHANPSGAALHGVYCRDGGATGAAIIANGVTTDAVGVKAQAVGSSGKAVYALGATGAVAIYAETASTGFAIHANAFGGNALKVEGKMTIDNSTLVTNLNADKLDGFHATSLCNVVTTNTGTCTVAGGGFQNLVTGSLASTVRTRGTSNIVYIENVSDARLKTDIQDESLGLDFINSLRPRSFRMLSSQSVKSHGLIYQEVSELLSECDSLAMLNDNEIGGVDYNGIVSPIIKAIQQLSDSVDQLKQEK